MSLTLEALHNRGRINISYLFVFFYTWSCVQYNTEKYILPPPTAQRNLAQASKDGRMIRTKREDINEMVSPLSILLYSLLFALIFNQASMLTSPPCSPPQFSWVSRSLAPSPPLALLRMRAGLRLPMWVTKTRELRAVRQVARPFRLRRFRNRRCRGGDGSNLACPYLQKRIKD